MVFLYILLALIAVFFIIGLVLLAGPNLSAYDTEPEYFYDSGAVSTGHGKLVEFLRENMHPPKGMKASESISSVRKGYETLGLNRTFKSEMKPGTAEFGGVSVKGEWTLPKNCDPSKRILYIHGGAFLIGSPVSHRPLTDSLAQRTDCAVFAIDYRLGPKNSRGDGIADCQAAYQWILENGPFPTADGGPAPVDKLGLAGDSAGGNLILMLTNWARNTGLRPVDAVYAMAPTLDGTGTGPSMRGNIGSDILLGRSLGPVAKLPQVISNWLLWVSGKINPSSPVASPIFDTLDRLPPTLIQVSNTEMLYSDSVRYYNKAKAAGSPVELQVWANMAHIFQHYDEMIPEANKALDIAGEFFKAHGVAAKSAKKAAPKPKPKSKSKAKPKAKPKTKPKTKKA